ncbi:YcjX family protein [Roseobacter sp. HKCCD9010]|uniref:YcjX family protein n=1 Tax=unclassified Roseobacter TaxID=196798 RepID=UPI00149238D1|nr:YcjX family protein [Rhodobacterales bacterium HKCCD4356]NNV13012.1 YcjX family protein [Roseobacter sp. HKCCD7357]NNV17263.1 YcjX family protein [Roseobacter sp. HKCCD8768]NNV26869.1 YcjX family protein [Roseobacter sp. HKCCD8192]NNV30989.1 YcjX family protein [Roseobacter sp. HKCCD9061]NNV35251.1 YcjX family protein [Roseobacter sp. HKCCD9073]NNV39649.1 YcjX family protein [Roseobacter sp. HKCCD9054]NNV43752.1 YcjX family protein [Roseobacter sp. HKCCD6497]NNV48035.1 YcjX family protei
MVIGRVADAVGRGIEDVTSSVAETFLDPVIRLGVTGVSRAGKTVFITSLVANLLDRARMPGLEAAQSGRIQAAFLQPQPDDTVPRFDFETHLAALTGPAPFWPESTRQVSELRLSLRVQPKGLLSGLSGPKTVHLDIVDYPGEWLLDLGLLDQTYVEWAAAALEQAKIRPGGAAYLAQLNDLDPTATLKEPEAQALARAYTAYLTTAREAGFSDCTPGRFLLPGELEGSPALTFAPLPESATPRGSLAREFARRFEAYKAQVVKPFFRNHFSRIDRQIVLVDALGAIHSGPQAVEDLRQTMAGILSAFRPGRNSFLTAIMGRRTDRILFAATKADHLHHTQHPKLTAIMEALVRDARDRADFAGAKTRAMAIAALRATVEETRTHNGETLDLVRGSLLDGGKQAAFHPGDLPEDPNALMVPARQGAEVWLDADFDVMRFAPALLSLKPGDGPPHIRLDSAAEFLLGDKLR